ncbi:MAG: glycosyltransferase [Candidatus Saccharibacteria bacterium]
MKKNIKPKSQSIKIHRQDIFVSTVVVVRSEPKEVNKYITKLQKLLNLNYTNYEIIIVDNGISVEEIKSITYLLAELPCIRIIKLSNLLKYDSAVFAGLEVSIGDCVCTLDPAIDPVEEIPNFIEKNKYYDVVQGISMIPILGVFGSGLGRKFFYWYNRKYIGIDIPINATHFASYSRRAINSLNSYGRNYRHIRHLARRIGYGYTTQEYTPTDNPSNQRRLKNGVFEALEIVTSYSTHPLRFVTWLGLFAGIINVVYACYIVVLNISLSNLAPGWTSTSMQLSLMFFVLFIIIVILSEYIGRIITESYREPNYLVADELVSTVALANVDRRNIKK